MTPAQLAGDPSPSSPAEHSPEWLAIVDGVADDALTLAQAGDLHGATAVLFELLRLAGEGTSRTDRVIRRWCDAVLTHVGADHYGRPLAPARFEVLPLIGVPLPQLTPAERWALDTIQAQAADDAVALEQLLAVDHARPALYGERLLALLVLVGVTLRYPASTSPR